MIKVRTKRKVASAAEALPPTNKVYYVLCYRAAVRIGLFQFGWDLDRSKPFKKSINRSGSGGFLDTDRMIRSAALQYMALQYHAQVGLQNEILPLDSFFIITISLLFFLDW